MVYKKDSKPLKPRKHAMNTKRGRNNVYDKTKKKDTNLTDKVDTNNTQVKVRKLNNSTK